jgi:hypothetical protein
VASVNQCTNGTKDANEAGIDCGGPCAACPATCTDAVKNGAETDTDCGGTCTTKCAQGKYCANDSDCVTGNYCRDSSGFVRTCQAASCTDKIKNQDETQVDCGGSSCPACETDQGNGSPLCANATVIPKYDSTHMEVQNVNVAGKVCFVFKCTPGTTAFQGGSFWEMDGRTITVAATGQTGQTKTTASGSFSAQTCGTDGKVTFAITAGSKGWAGFNSYM